MEKRRMFLLSAFLLLAAFRSALAEDLRSYFAVDDKITLKLNPSASAKITRLLWKHGANLLGDWTNGEFTYFGRFKGRTTMDTTTGHLEIKNASKSDSGRYEVEVNNEIQAQRYDVKVIGKVPKPSIWVSPVSCSPSLAQCRLVCEAKIDESEPATYRWEAGDGVWKDGTSELNIDNETKIVKTFTCQVKNPVSLETSEAIRNPFFKEPPVTENSGHVGIGVSAAVVVVAAVAGIVYWKQDDIRNLISRFNGGGSSGDGKSGQTADPASGQPMLPTGNGKQDPPAGSSSEGKDPPAGPKEE